MTKVEIQKEFSIGSEWLYYKLYCGEKSADDILISSIKPFIEQALNENLIDKWFFIRYHDPKSHLRLRFHLKNRAHIGNLILKFHEVLQPLIHNNSIWKVQTDTYKRELKRYGALAINDIESLFFINSTKVVNIISTINTDEQRLVEALKLTNTILSNFNLTTQQKLEFSEHSKQAFREEFNANKITTKQLNTLYRNTNINLTSLDIEQPYTISSTYNLLMEMNKNNTLQVPLHNLIASIIHMCINRLFRSQQRQYELVIYDFSSKYFRTQIAKQHA